MQNLLLRSVVFEIFYGRYGTRPFQKYFLGYFEFAWSWVRLFFTDSANTYQTFRLTYRLTYIHTDQTFRCTYVQICDWWLVERRKKQPINLCIVARALENIAPSCVKCIASGPLTTHQFPVQSVQLFPRTVSGWARVHVHVCPTNNFCKTLT